MFILNRIQRQLYYYFSMRIARFINFDSSDSESNSSFGEVNHSITEKGKGMSEKKIDFFTDPSSPYIDAPENIKSLFSKQ